MIFLTLPFTSLIFITVESRLSIYMNLIEIKIHSTNEWRINKANIFSERLDWKDNIVSSFHDTMDHYANTCLMMKWIDTTRPLILSNTANPRDNDNAFLWWINY